MLKSIAGALFVALWSPLALAQTPTPEPVSSATPEPEVTPLPATPSPTPALEKKAKGRPAPEISGALQIIYKERFDKDGDDEVEPSLFRIQRVKIRIEGELTERVSYQVQIDPRSPLIENVLRDAYVDYDLLPGGAIDQKIRAGQMRTPFGYENWASSSDLYTPNRTEVSELHGRGITNRDIGVGLIGDVPLGGGFRLENAMSITNGAGMGAQADDDNKKNYFGKLNGRYKNKDRDLTVWLGGSAGMGTLNEEGIPGVPTDPGEHVEFKRVGRRPGGRPHVCLFRRGRRTRLGEECQRPRARSRGRQHGSPRRMVRAAGGQVSVEDRRTPRRRRRTLRRLWGLRRNARVHSYDGRPLVGRAQARQGGRKAATRRRASAHRHV